MEIDTIGDSLGVIIREFKEYEDLIWNRLNFEQTIMSNKKIYLLDIIMIKKIRMNIIIWPETSQRITCRKTDIGALFKKDELSL